jgi:tRNA1(Val) A37 N6-methylase TrmN6
MALRWERFTFVDLGSGKGKALLIAARRPFARVVGIELSPMLVDISLRNIASYRPVPLACSDIEVLCGDAAGFEFHDQPLVIYCNNPFRWQIMQAVLANLERSLREHHRELLLVYIVPEMHELLCRSGFLKVLESGKDYCVYGTGNITSGRSSTRSRAAKLVPGPASHV